MTPLVYGRTRTGGFFYGCVLAPELVNSKVVIQKRHTANAETVVLHKIKTIQIKVPLAVELFLTTQ